MKTIQRYICKKCKVQFFNESSVCSSCGRDTQIDYDSSYVDGHDAKKILNELFEIFPVGFKMNNQTIKDLPAMLTKLVKEGIETYECLDKYMIHINGLQGEYSKLEQERDEAIKLLEEYSLNISDDDLKILTDSNRMGAISMTSARREIRRRELTNRIKKL